MGGNLFPQARRMNREEYPVICESLLNGLRSAAIPVADIPLSYRSKESYGDVDVITYYSPPKEEEILSRVKKQFGEIPVVNRGDGFSLLYKDEFQVDLINCPDNPSFALQYHDWNDLGGMLGLICRQFGLKLRNQGLYYPVYEDESRTTKIGEVHVTGEFQVVQRFLGISECHKGFDTLEDIFKYVVSSPYFRASQFEFGNLTSKQRLRNSKRPTFIKFNEWLQSCISPSDLERPEIDKDLVSKKFPNVFEKANELKEEYKQFKAIKAKFNGNIVNRVTGLMGLPLGQFMDRLRSKSWFQDFLLDNSPKQIEAYIESTYQKELLDNETKRVHQPSSTHSS